MNEHGYDPNARDALYDPPDPAGCQECGEDLNSAGVCDYCGREPSDAEDGPDLDMEEDGRTI